MDPIELQKAHISYEAQAAAAREMSRKLVKPVNVGDHLDSGQQHKLIQLIEKKLKAGIKQDNRKKALCAARARKASQARKSAKCARIARRGNR